ncbi:Tox-REase-5 domain-containing protein [Providencia manganoxydans]|uniref:Tox-REase-5 domain-containing protein n=1 Tax=Providencia manganoxydans TaxID=2923283 RepID=UPI0032DA6F5D
MIPLIILAGAAVTSAVSTIVLGGAMDRANNTPDYSPTKPASFKRKYIPVGMPMPEGWDEAYDEYLEETQDQVWSTSITVDDGLPISSGDDSKAKERMERFSLAGVITAAQARTTCNDCPAADGVWNYPQERPPVKRDINFYYEFYIAQNEKKLLGMDYYFPPMFDGESKTSFMPISDELRTYEVFNSMKSKKIMESIAFDSFREQYCELQEAKGNYLWALEKDLTFKDFFPYENTLAQARVHEFIWKSFLPSNLMWYFLQEPVQQVFQAHFIQNGIDVPTQYRPFIIV